MFNFTINLKGNFHKESMQIFLTDKISHQKRKAETERAIAATDETRAVAPLSTKVKLKSVV